MGILKVDTVQDQDGNDIIQESAGTVTVGQSGQTVAVAGGATLSVPTLLVNGESVTAITLPTVTSLSPDTIENTQTSVTITGTNFVNGAVVNAISTTGAIFTADTVTFNSATSITAQFTLATDGNYYIRVENPDGLAGRSSTALLSVSDAPTWSTAAGSLGTMDDQTAGSFTVTATSDSAITYSKVSGDFPGGLTLNSSTGEISGTESGATADTTYNFTIRATDAEGQTADRAFSITVEVLYVIDNSLRFDDGSSDYLTRTTSGTITTFTFSLWVKRSSLKPSGRQNLIGLGPGSGNIGFFEFNNDRLAIVFDGTGTYWPKTDAVFRDSSAWYHVVASVDTTQATASNRIKIYINGVQETSFSSSSYPSQNYVTKIGGAHVHNIGNDSEQTVPYFDGSMSHVHFIDGTAYDASAFGEYDANGVWKIKTSPSVTYGTNGFFILKDGNSVTDQSGNGNNFTVAGGTLTNTEDNPSNVFCTLNPLSHLQSWSITNGNTRFQGSTVQDWKSAVGATLGASTGKYYWEVKWVTGDSYSVLGVLPIDQYWRCNKGDTTNFDVYEKANCVQLSTSGTGNIRNYVSADVSGTQRSLNDILMFAIDMDNKKMWLGENGVWDNSGNPATGANPTWDTTEFNSDWDNGFVPYCQSYAISAQTEFHFNFGNGYFGTTAVASAGTNASGIGIFEYDVPTGYTALSTKGLNL